MQLGDFFCNPKSGYFLYKSDEGRGQAVSGAALEWLCRWVALRLPTLRVVMIGFSIGGWCCAGMALSVGCAALTLGCRGVARRLPTLGVVCFVLGYLLICMDCRGVMRSATHHKYNITNTTPQIQQAQKNPP